MKTNAIAQWFGSNRILAQTVGVQLGKLEWCGVPAMGGAPELPFIKTRTGLANDLHRHVINLARVIGDQECKSLLIDALDRRLFHPDELYTAQRRCLEREAPQDGLFGVSQPRDQQKPDVEWAADYFLASWMGRGGVCGTKSEFSQGPSIRWSASGGDSAKRFRSAIDSIDGWHSVLRYWQFACMDFFTFLHKDNTKDQAGHGLYVDMPWPGAGDGYTHKFTEAMQVKAAIKLRAYLKTRVVIRFGDHPLIRELYPKTQWTWVRQTSRDQANNDCAEVLIINGPSFATKEAA